MSPFQRAYQAEHEARREVTRWRALYNRKRRQMGLMPGDQGGRLHYRLKDEERAATDRHISAEATLRALWDAYSRSLPPHDVIDEERAYLRDAGREGARGLIGATVRFTLARYHGLDITADEETALLDEILVGSIDTQRDDADTLAAAFVTVWRGRR